MDLMKSSCANRLKVLEIQPLDEHCSLHSDLPDATIVVRPSNVDRRASTKEGTEKTKTPPIPSSSPGPANDHMDISPLPHKPPFIQRTSGLTPIGRRDITNTEEGPPVFPGNSVLPACLPMWVVL